MPVSLIVVTPTVHIKRLLAAGFRAGGRANHYTATLSRLYDDQINATADAKALPLECVWSIEESPSHSEA